MAFFVALPEGTAGFCLNHALHLVELHFQTATVSVRSALSTPDRVESACVEALEVEVVAATFGCRPGVLKAL